jgi:hypothetical protein
LGYFRLWYGARRRLRWYAGRWGPGWRLGRYACLGRSARIYSLAVIFAGEPFAGQFVRDSENERCKHFIIYGLSVHSKKLGKLTKEFEPQAAFTLEGISKVRNLS